jgi:hypothetical protein
MIIKASMYGGRYQKGFRLNIRPFYYLWRFFGCNLAVGSLPELLHLLLWPVFLHPSLVGLAVASHLTRTKYCLFGVQYDSLGGACTGTSMIIRVLLYMHSMLKKESSPDPSSSSALLWYQINITTSFAHIFSPFGLI